LKYVKASSVLPEKLIIEIQKYVQGESIYIPTIESTRKKWGSKSGGREYIEKRNALIKDAFRGGTSIQDLADIYFLSVETIKKIVYTKR